MPLGQYVLTTATQLVRGVWRGGDPHLHVGVLRRRPGRGGDDPAPGGHRRADDLELAGTEPEDQGDACGADLLRGLDLASAVNLANYRLVTAGRDKKFGTRDDKIIALRSASYNPTTHKVTLVPRKKLAVSVKYRLTVNGTSASGVEDLAGNLLDGNRRRPRLGELRRYLQAHAIESAASIVSGARSGPIARTAPEPGVMLSPAVGAGLVGCYFRLGRLRDSAGPPAA